MPKVQKALRREVAGGGAGAVRRRKERVRVQPSAVAPKPGAVLDEVREVLAAEQKDPVKQRILRGAAKVFGERGFGATSVEAILAESQVSRRTFYRSFRSKEDVLRTLFDNSVQMLLRAVRERSEAPRDRMELARASVDAYVRVQAKAGPLARVLLLEQFSPDSPLIEQRNRAVAMFTDLLTKASVQKGMAPPDPVLVSAVVAAINQVCVQMASEHKDGPWDVERAKRAILRILFALDDRSDPSTWS